ncbi:MAG: hypothetical protein M1368_12475 [Thaumarchaeota archaeon]|nr:hypothetical protein [Nitrososphaerota archaeon]
MTSLKSDSVFGLFCLFAILSEERHPKQVIAELKEMRDPLTDTFSAAINARMASTSFDSIAPLFHKFQLGDTSISMIEAWVNKKISFVQSKATKDGEQAHLGQQLRLDLDF